MRPINNTVPTFTNHPVTPADSSASSTVAKTAFDFLSTGYTAETLPPEGRQAINSMLMHLQAGDVESDGCHYTACLPDDSRVDLNITHPEKITLWTHDAEIHLGPLHMYYDSIRTLAEACVWANEEAPEISRKDALQELKRCVVSQSPQLNLKQMNLTSLPALPASLTNLDVSDNQLTSLPALPVSLTSLYVSDNQLTNLPALPASLTELYANNNQLTNLPALPASLIALDASNNQLTNLPALPASLIALDASNNQLTNLPALPASVNWLDVNNNQLTSLPALPVSLALQHISDNQLTRQLNLDNSSPAGEPLMAEYNKIFQKYPDKAQPFWRFLSGLGASFAAKQPEFRRKIWDFLIELPTKPALVELCLELALESSTSCTDRASLGWNNMQIARMVHDTMQHPQNVRPDEFMTVARTVYRTTKLEEIAADKVAKQIEAGQASDSVEVYLAFQVLLKNSLHFPAALVSGMDFQQIAGVTEDDARRAGQQVLQHERDELTGWMNQWSPCQDYLKKDMSDNEKVVFDDRLLAEFNSQFQRLKGQNAGIDGTDVDMALGSQALAAAQQEMYGPLMVERFGKLLEPVPTELSSPVAAQRGLPDPVAYV